MGLRSLMPARFLLIYAGVTGIEPATMDLESIALPIELHPLPFRETPPRRRRCRDTHSTRGCRSPEPVPHRCVPLVISLCISFFAGQPCVAGHLLDQVNVDPELFDQGIHQSAVTSADDKLCREVTRFGENPYVVTNDLSPGNPTHTVGVGRVLADRAVPWLGDR